MRGVVIAIIIAVIAIVIVFGFFVLKPVFMNEAVIETIEPEEFSIIKPEIDNYCQLLSEKAVNDLCPVCKDLPFILDAKQLIEEEAHLYTLSEGEEGSTIINIDFMMLYGSETRGVNVSFEVDLEQTIIGMDLPTLECQ